MRRTSPLKPQDILILLKLLTLEATPRVIDLAVDVGVSPSEISHGLERLVRSQLLSSDKKAVLKRNALEFLVYGLKYVFPVELGPVVRGIATAHSALPLSKGIVSAKEDQYVWPFPDGDIRGHSVTPLYSSVPLAASKDRKLHELLSLVDALRIGRTREQKIARRELEKRFGVELGGVA
jgi:hypothetical protein